MTSVSEKLVAAIVAVMEEEKQQVETKPRKKVLVWMNPVKERACFSHWSNIGLFVDLDGTMWDKFESSTCPESGEEFTVWMNPKKYKRIFQKFNPDSTVTVILPDEFDQEEVWDHCSECSK